MTITELVQDAHERSKRKGWYEGGPVNIPEKLALIHSEVSEALEDYRNGDMKTMELWDDSKPVGFPSELADIVIRVADLAGHLGIDLEAEIRIKSKFNERRSHRHGGKAC